MFKQFDQLLKSAEEALEKMNPIVAAGLRGAAVGAIGGAIEGIAGGKAAKTDEEEDELKKKPKKAEKAERTLDYSSMKPKKTPEAEAPTINYSQMSTPTRTPGTATSEAGFKVPSEKKKPLADPRFRAKLANQRRQSGFSKSEDFGKITEALTKSLRSQHTDGEISEMLKAAVDAGQLHPHVLLEWSNFKTVNPAVMNLVRYEDEA